MVSMDGPRLAWPRVLDAQQPADVVALEGLAFLVDQERLNAEERVSCGAGLRLRRVG